MKVYVVNQFDQNYSDSRYTEFVGTFGVFIMKHYADQSINAQAVLDELDGETYRYEIVEFDL